MLFLDGVGIGKSDPAMNPFFTARMPALRSMLGNSMLSLRKRRRSSKDAIAIPLDATLGMKGLPQSGTGQTALFTGLNAAKIIGKHHGPFAYSTLRPLIARHGVFRQMKNAGKTCLFANAFPDRFFDYVEKHPARRTVATQSWMETYGSLCDIRMLRKGTAISADITNAGWRELGYPDLPSIQAEEAGERLANLAHEFDFVLFEYWNTDRAGHSRDMSQACKSLERFDSMLAGILAHIDRRRVLLCITSDHGNIEDLSTKSHTRNPVPLVLCGIGSAIVARQIEGSRKPSLTSVTPALISLSSPT